MTIQCLCLFLKVIGFSKNDIKIYFYVEMKGGWSKEDRWYSVGFKDVDKKINPPTEKAITKRRKILIFDDIKA